MPKDPNRVAAGKRSKRKGNAYENQLAKRFKEWWGSGEWARTPSSGGWATRAVREDFRTCGDIITTASDFPFCVEAKNQKGWKLDQLLTAPKSQLYKFWEQAVEETPDGLIPLVIARNMGSEFVFCDNPLVRWVISSKEKISYLCLRPHFLFIIQLKDFFSIDPDEFKERESAVIKVGNSYDEPTSEEAGASANVS